MTPRHRVRTPLLTAFVLVLSGSVMGTDALADHDGNVDSMYYEPHAGVEPPPRSPGRLAPATGSLLGTHSDDSESWEPEEQGIVKLEEALGRRMDINNRYEGDFEEFAEKGEMSWMETWNVEEGRIPLVGWGCTNSDRINDGSLDDVIRRTAQVMRDFGHEFFMRYCWEMDGARKQGEVKGPEKFVAAWQRMYKIFQEEQATNVIWVWTPNAAGFKDKRSYSDDQPPGPYFYPGDDYVDWIAADGYNWGVSNRDQGDRWRHVVEIFDEFMVFARAHPKPIMIGEYGAQEQPQDPEAKPEWLWVAHQTFMDLPRTEECPWCGVYSDVAAIVYFDVNYGKHGDWRIMSSPESLAAYKKGSDDPWYHQMHTIGWAPAANRPEAPPPPPPAAEQPPVEPSPAPAPAQAAEPASPPSGYWMLGTEGTVYPFGDAADHGNAPVGPAPAVDLAPVPARSGYWVADSGGGVHVHGDAPHLGGVPPQQLAEDEIVTSLSPTPSGAGYWVVTNRGRVFAFGDAVHLGDLADVPLNAPVLDSIPTPTGDGYYMVAADGGIFSFGDAQFFGSMGDSRLNAPVQSLVPDPDGAGYWLVAADGGVFAFEAPFRGSMGDQPLNEPVTGMVPFGSGYLMVAADGGVFNFSDHPFHGSLGDNPPPHPIVAVAALD